MKVSVSIELIWQLACREAIAGEFKEIEPEHLLLAFLKFAETPPPELDPAGVGGEAAQALAGDLAAIRAEVESRKINPGVLRRQLRTVLGRGANPFDGTQLHRAPACREYFDRAAAFASTKGSEVVTGSHLFQCLLETPTPLLAQVLAGLGHSTGQAAGQPLVSLYEAGKDLNRLVCQQHLAQDMERAAEARALLRVLGERQRNGVFLVFDDSEVVRKIVFTAARLAAGPGEIPGLGKRRIIDLSEVSDSSAPGTPGADLGTLLRKADGLTDLVLFLPSAGTKAKGLHAWTGVLRELLLNGRVQSVGRLPLCLQDMVQKDPGWRRLTHLVHVASSASSEVPDEL